MFSDLLDIPAFLRRPVISGAPAPRRAPATLGAAPRIEMTDPRVYRERERQRVNRLADTSEIREGAKRIRDRARWAALKERVVNR